MTSITSAESRTQLVEGAGVRISMDGRGRALGNVFTERLWRSLKYEEVYLKDYATPREARQSIAAYFENYNHRRPHQSLGHQTPASVYLSADESHTPLYEVCQE